MKYEQYEMNATITKHETMFESHKNYINKMHGDVAYIKHTINELNDLKLDV